MRAILVKELGFPDKLVMEDIPSPHPGKGEVIVSVKAAGVNYHDTLIIQGLYQHKPTLPFSPGADAAGVVKEVGEGVTGYKPGDPVMAFLRFGAFAEEIIVPQVQLTRLRPGTDFEKAAAFGLTYTTTYHGLHDCGRLARGETLLVLAAGGGIGAAAVELGKLMGAHVIACASSEAKLETARKLGADETINYAKEDLREAVKRLTKGRGVDVVCDPVGGKYAEPALRSMAYKGRYLVIGFASGEIPKLPVHWALLKSCSIVGVSRGNFMDVEPEAAARNADTLTGWLAERKLHPVISVRYPFEKTAQALDDLMNQRVAGKEIITI